MKKFLLLLLFSHLYLFANSDEITAFQNEFSHNVLEKNIFKKHFRLFLEKNCLLSDDNCVDKQIARLKTWESTSANQALQEDLVKKHNKTQLSNEYFQGVQKNIFKLIDEKKILKSQFITLLDLSKQLITVTLYDNDTHEIYLIGSDFVSSGDINKESETKAGEDHFLQTPTGIFENLKGWRSDGKYNEDKSVLAYGQKGRFVFYFGKQKSVRYNSFDAFKNKLENKKDWKLITDYLEFAMHSHESSKPMGIPNSHGCIRITHELNLFLDENLVLHKNNLNKSHLLPQDISPEQMPLKIKYAGKYLIVVNKI
ncbi:MAG: hypothetical protein ACNI3C_06490 [Candidatus Marinarcus sp.]|uniref:hypothetical protein n=1 Tax=Candidatus Marinarcus sp. TaxID=3100987 RepID=UPI003AFFE9A8